MSATTMREGGAVLFGTGFVSMVLWVACMAVYCTATGSWNAPIKDAPSFFSMLLAIWMYSQALGAVWWILGRQAARR